MKILRIFFFCTVMLLSTKFNAQTCGSAYVTYSAATGCNTGYYSNGCVVSWGGHNYTAINGPHFNIAPPNASYWIDNGVCGGGSTQGGDIWQSNGVNAYLNPSYTKVGIGTNNPQYALDVIGITKMKGKVSLGNDVLQLHYPELVNGGKNHYMYFANRFFPYSPNEMFSVIGAYNAPPTGTTGSEGPRPLILQAQQDFVNNLGVGYHTTAPEAKLSVMCEIVNPTGFFLNYKHNQDYGYAFKTLVDRNKTKAIGVYNRSLESDVFLVMGDGRVFATELNVRMAGNFFPDYVFSKDYKLMPLTDLEKYIQENKKLPKIPSASEVGKNGINVGDMNTLLVEKVEELTLYIIELQKQIIELQKKNSQEK